VLLHGADGRPVWAIVLGVVAGLVLLGAARGGVAAEDAPRAVLSRATQDLGVVAPGEPATATFEVKNEGDAPLVVTAGKPTPLVPGFTVDVRGTPVAPGGVATVTMAFDTRKLAGPGVVEVPLETNDPHAGRLTATLRAEVRPLLRADPGYARYNVVQHEREGTIAQTVWSADGATFRVLAVRSPVDALRVRFEETPAARRREVAGSQWLVETTLASDAPVGALTGDVVVVTDHPRQKELRIPLSGFVRPVLAVTPPQADLGEVDGTRPLRFTLDVKSFATEPIALERVEVDLPGATAEVLPVVPGRQAKVRVSVPAGLPDGAFAGVVRIFTDSATAPRVDVPVRGRARATSPSADR